MNRNFFIVICAFFIACNDESATRSIEEDTISNRQDSVTQTSPQQKEEMCFARIMNRDTTVMKLERSGPVLSGRLLFDNYQIDGSRGQVNGNIDGDILKLWYDFMAEGERSVMEIWFKKTDSGYIRGLGDVAISGDTSYYKDHDLIEYRDDQLFKKDDCRIADQKLNW